jgi:Holliday junction resolvase
MALALKRDSIEPEIVAALERAGCSVWNLNGKGVPDLLVGRAGKNYLLEVKDPLTGRLTQDQIYWHRTWRGKVHIVRSVDEALRAVELTK